MTTGTPVCFGAIQCRADFDVTFSNATMPSNHFRFNESNQTIELHSNYFPFRFKVRFILATRVVEIAIRVRFD